MGYDLRVLSLGAGVQSSTLYLMACLGEVGPLPDFAIFADTQSEPAHVYDHLKWMESQFGEILPIRRSTVGSLREAVMEGAVGTKRFASVPFWSTGGDGAAAPGRRHCTREYKIDVVKREVRDALGLYPGQRAAGRYRVEEWVGISLDEYLRAKPSRYSWVTTRWPLLYDVPMRRHDCIEWMKSHGFPIPGKSACTFCPYRNIGEWRQMRDEDPDAFADAVAVDKLIRRDGPMRGMERLQYVHRSLMPLDQAVDDETVDDGQMDLFNNECEGMCGV